MKTCVRNFFMTYSRSIIATGDRNRRVFLLMGLSRRHGKGQVAAVTRV
ncbi:hypothetical protein BSS2_I0883 [Brucella suis bv. 1 str. S2]|uniref:Uncharacterized protein n=2 Tax=Brucella TaxID=234 RepID=A0A0H3G768_BRUSU|nr:hypothetical protein BR0901 [Brucella suis 1330]ACU47888.1 hypothetical protein BMI_I900 [Brucella microti CCM 4915]AEK54227.1 hypothetical protein BPI_I941 [Brucella pinnipedialis B2/94]AEU05914.1 hypothetical protein BSVBI22_A0897 [Brucella suis VBI22]AHN46538.1 hypothetical protein BSS2_I0883 [Brucella suis bv. 1 str. S2]EFM57594.1 Hypothetical protein BIBO1_0461 [Brucella inopinata BO1]EFM60838.1 Hypothetical protein BIBO2_0196 [Brucella sp. BO2]CDL76303.1 unnamed protein product [Bru